MKLWLSKNGEVPLREQITRQIMLAIASGDLIAGQKLPSVREIALRYDVHPNTVSAAYRRLEISGWILAKRGSGVFVCRRDSASRNESELDFLISEFFRSARRQGFSDRQIETKLRERFSRPRIEKVFVIESDRELNEILCAEIRTAFETEVAPLGNQQFSGRALAVAINETEAKRVLPENIRFLRLQLNSVQDSMSGQRRPQSDEMIGIASGWEVFLRWAQTMLLAAGIENEQIVLRDARETNWQSGLKNCAVVVSDSLTARRLPENLNVRVFRLISDRSIAELESLLG